MAGAMGISDHDEPSIFTSWPMGPNASKFLPQSPVPDCDLEATEPAAERRTSLSCRGALTLTGLLLLTNLAVLLVQDAQSCLNQLSVIQRRACSRNLDTRR